MKKFFSSFQPMKLQRERGEGGKREGRGRGGKRERRGREEGGRKGRKGGWDGKRGKNKKYASMPT